MSGSRDAPLRLAVQTGQGAASNAAGSVFVSAGRATKSYRQGTSHAQSVFVAALEAGSPRPRFCSEAASPGCRRPSPWVGVGAGLQCLLSQGH